MQPLNMPTFETDMHKLVGTTKTLELANVSIGYGVLGKHYLHISCTLSGTVIVSNILLGCNCVIPKQSWSSNFNCNVENAVRFLINNRLLSIFTKLQRASLKKIHYVHSFLLNTVKLLKVSFTNNAANPFSHPWRENFQLFESLASSDRQKVLSTLRTKRHPHTRTQSHRETPNWNYPEKVQSGRPC